MKIYALRDRLIDYFLQPFAAPDDKNVLAAISRTVNGNQETDIAQAPHHYEIWRLGHVDDQGHITPDREFITDCSSLIRPSIRRAAEPGAGTAPAPTAPNAPTASGAGNTAQGAGHRPVPGKGQGENTEAPEIRPAPRGGYPPPDLAT